MEHFTQILIIVFGAGGLGTFVGSYVLFYRANKRKNEATATIAEAEAIKAFAAEWKEIADARDIKLDQKDAKIDSMYIVLNDWRDKFNAKSDECQTIKLENQSLKFRLCNKRGCEGREPQTGY